MYSTLPLTLRVCMFIACSSACSTSCVCIEDKATCITSDPSKIVLNENIREVVLQDIESSLLSEQTFSTNPQWSKVETLKIFAVGYKFLANRVFTGLSGLTYLGFHNENMHFMKKNTFSGLNNLKELDFSNNIRLRVSSFKKIMNSTHLPRLNKLRLNGMYSAEVDAIDANNDLFQSVAGRDIKRNITHLDISNINFRDFNFDAFFKSGLCNTVHEIYLRNATIQNMHGFGYVNESCSSLKIIDISDSQLPNILRHHSAMSTLASLCRLTIFYFNVEELYMNGLGTKKNTPPLQDDRDGDLRSCPYRLRTFSLENNLIKRLNSTVKLHNQTQKTMEWISLSGNILEFISPQFLCQSMNLKYLDLSGNHLHKMQEYYEDQFKILTKYNTKLKVLKLNRNGISCIPFNMFLTNNELEELDLSHNNISSLDFHIGLLTNLKVLNLSYNAISYIDAKARATMQQLAAAKNPQNLTIDLSNMPYICSCDDNHIETIKWIHRNLDTFIARPREDYICTLQGERLYIFQNALEKTNAYCREQNIKRNLAICLPIVCVFLLIGLLIFFKTQRSRRRKRERKNLRSQIELGEFPMKFVAFLSFSSDDAELVVNTILPKLNSELQLKTGTNRVLVCSGDRHFRPGYALGEEIIRCIEDSAVIIMAVSKHFCQKEWCRKEVQETYDQNKPIVLLFLERVEPDEMGKVLRKVFNRYAHASWIPDTDGGHIEPDWPILCDALLDLTVAELEKNRVH
ncbi:hypothetical protein DPMN_066076 [Dreissena polymorpha]|uniref:TIR domain-containing protein n=1 Tax=Dreissena polymorpha TaxID=45954 RepID=A0A9D3YST7_DREPO|nr:hypothetical protein DPMN_066076 [Dreissena polymorpha]